MPHELVEDEDGYYLRMLRIHKNRFAGGAFNEHTLNNMSTVKLRDDDILLCSYAKSGCHWLWENLRFLQSGKIILDNVEKEMTMMELKSIEYLDKLPSPRILNTHTFFDDMPQDLLKGKNKVVFIYRNPKDIAVSFFHHHRSAPGYAYEGQFCHYLKRFAKGSVSGNNIFEFWKMWEEGLKQNPQIPHIVLSFEELTKNPISERRRLANFLGHEYGDRFLQEVAEATSIDRMKERKGADSAKDVSGNLVWYRKGIVGDWKNYFTLSENEWFDELVSSQMSKYDMYKFVYSLDD